MYNRAVSSTDKKIAAREQVIKAYRSLSGLNSIPMGKQYWTLCGPDPEIDQFVKDGFLTKSQFCGVDNNPEFITINNLNHPEAKWFCGDWLDVMDLCREAGVFNPALIYFDSTSTVISDTIYHTIGSILNVCPSSTVVIPNIMVSNSRNGKFWNPDDFLERVFEYVCQPNLWFRESGYHLYKAKRTEMATYALKHIG